MSTTSHDKVTTLPHPHTSAVAAALDSADYDLSTCQQVYDAEYVLTYCLAGRRLAEQLSTAGVDRYATVAWVSSDGNSGSIDLDLIQASDLLTMLRTAVSA